MARTVKCNCDSYLQTHLLKILLLHQNVFDLFPVHSALEAKHKVVPEYCEFVLQWQVLTSVFVIAVCRSTFWRFCFLTVSSVAMKNLVSILILCFNLSLSSSSDKVLSISESFMYLRMFSHTTFAITLLPGCIGTNNGWCHTLSFILIITFLSMFVIKTHEDTMDVEQVTISYIELRLSWMYFINALCTMCTRATIYHSFVK